MDEDAGDLGVLEAEAGLELGDDLVDAAHGQMVRERAVAVDLDAGGGASVAAGDGDLVDVEDLGKVPSDDAKLFFDVAGGLKERGAADRGGLAFHVGEQGADLGDLAAHVAFELAGDLVGLAQGHGLGDFKVLLDMEGAFVLLDADVVDGKVGASGGGADAVEDAF